MMGGNANIKEDGEPDEKNNKQSKMTNDSDSDSDGVDDDDDDEEEEEYMGGGGSESLSMERRNAGGKASSPPVVGAPVAAAAGGAVSGASGGDDAVESSSTGSSSGGKGYSADCSASDQSSDDSGGAPRKEDNVPSSKSSNNDDDDNNNEALLNLSVQRMNLDPTTGTGDAGAVPEGTGATGEGPSTAGPGDPNLTSVGAQKQPQRAGLVSKVSSSSNSRPDNSNSNKEKVNEKATHHHHHHHHRRRSSHHHHYHGRHSSSKQQREGAQSYSPAPAAAAGGATSVASAPAAPSPSTSIPRDRTGALDIDAIMNYKKEAEKTCMLQPGLPPPQWNGVQITHPMDTRIDLSAVQHILGAGISTLHPTAVGNPSGTAGTALPQSLSYAAAAPDSSPAAEVPSVETYYQLFEVVRPFFQAIGIPAGIDGQQGDQCQQQQQQPTLVLPSQQEQQQQQQQHQMIPPFLPHAQEMDAPMQGIRGVANVVAAAMYAATRNNNSNNNNGSTSEAASSEGFTSFFTTTANSASPETSDLDKKQEVDQKIPERASAGTYRAVGGAPEEDGGTNTDSSSMVVLARVKRKHRQRAAEGGRGAEESNNSNNSTSYAERQARVREHAPDQQHQAGSHVDAGHHQQDPLADEQQHQQWQVGIGIAAQPPQEMAPGAVAVAAAVEPRVGHQDGGNHAQAEGSESASSFSARQNGAAADGRAAGADAEGGGGDSSSSSNNQINAQQAGGDMFGVPLSRIVTDVGSSSNRTDSNKDTTASGSGGNTGSGSNGSGQGSSGSGNEGRGSSEELQKEDGEAQVDASESAGSECAKDAPNTDNHRHAAETGTHPPLPSQQQQLQQHEDDNQTRATREQKLIDKKRKRIEMRREYEAQQQSESSDSIDVKSELLRPAKPIAMDQAMVFSKIPRIVVQAVPPFLVVHSNAAYTRLTGVESHTIVGKPISQLLATPETTAKPNDVEQPDASSTESGNPQGSDDAPLARPAARTSQKPPPVERLIASCGFGQLQMLHVTVKPHQMVGRNVTVIKDQAAASAVAASSRQRDEAGNDSSLTSSWDGQFGLINCRVSIAPIVTGQAEPATVTDKETEPRAKRRKHAGLGEADKPEREASQYRRHHHRQVVTHFVIQLEAILSHETNKHGASQESLSSHSTSVEARLLGLTKAELQQQRSASVQPRAPAEPNHEMEEEADASESTEVRDPVSTVG